MRLLVVYAHPVSTSFVSALHETVVDTLRASGHTVDDCDLYAEKFDPILSDEERRRYHEPERNQYLVAEHVSRLRQCDGIVFVFPTWYYGMPAILKGYFDRVWLPGVAFKMHAGRVVPTLHHIKLFAAVTTFGSPRWVNKAIFADPNKKVFMRGLRRLVAHNARAFWLPMYSLDASTEQQRKRFLERVKCRFSRI